jgi:dolichyl-phosphate-mannose--protein O-mannosyl transferase
MTSGQYLTWFLIVSVLVVFPIWEFAQLYRRRKGNKSALTMSQYVTRTAKGGSSSWTWFAILFPFFIFIGALWLSFHWWSWCFAFGWFCKVDI